LTDTEFYALPAHRLRSGMSTSDGQDVLTVWKDGPTGSVNYDVYTPSDDSSEDAVNRGETDARFTGWDALVSLAVFTNTRVDGREHPCPYDCPLCQARDAAEEGTAGAAPTQTTTPGDVTVDED
jgi:hypothetical protein